MTDTPSFDRLLRRACDRRDFLRGALGATIGGVALYTAGCGDGGSPAATPAGTGATAKAGASAMPTTGANPVGLRPSLLTQEFVAGQDNRFAVGLVDSQNRLLKNSDVHLRFYVIGADGATGTFRGEGDAEYVELNIEGAHAHDESSQAFAGDDSVSFYVANTPFDDVGKWGVEITATPKDGSAATKIQAPFDVLEKPKSPAVGTVPPASTNDTAATNPNTESLCSRTPACNLHDTVIADVLGKGRPLVVQFSTPAYCVSRFCGPVLEVLLGQVPKYADKIDFIHIEVWQDFQLQQYRPASVEWNLPTEPYTFFMTSAGKVAGKIEAVFGEEELVSALDQLVKL
jgi:hypothetical protein